MANVDRPHGFTPVGHMCGGEIRSHMYHIASDYGTRLGIGDVVILAGATDATGRWQNIARAAATNVPVGVIVGFKPKPESGLEQLYSPANEEGYAFVVDDPNVIFEAQIDDVVLIAKENFGLNADLLAGNCSTTTGRSIEEIDSSTILGTNSLQFKLLSIVNREDNELGVHADILVIFNIHAYKCTTGVTGQ